MSIEIAADVLGRLRISKEEFDARLARLEQLKLEHGSHSSFEHGACAMEGAAWLAGERHGDSPSCVCRVITRIMVRWNDRLADEPRQRLKALLPVILGTRGSKALEERRAWMAVDWALRVATPVWLRSAQLTAEAAELEALPEIVDKAIWRAVRERVGAMLYPRLVDAARAKLAEQNLTVLDSAIDLIRRMAAVRE